MQGRPNRCPECKTVFTIGRRPDRPLAKWLGVIFLLLVFWSIWRAAQYRFLIFTVCLFVPLAVFVALGALARIVLKSVHPNLAALAVATLLLWVLHSASPDYSQSTSGFLNRMQERAQTGTNAHSFRVYEIVMIFQTGIYLLARLAIPFLCARWGVEIVDTIRKRKGSMPIESPGVNGS